uniref:Uncharacterized protein n=1 Tax=Arundo donax TaxID=35708 RepID=A0A0A9DZ51_ARUDO
MLTRSFVCFQDLAGWRDQQDSHYSLSQNLD